MGVAVSVILTIVPIRQTIQPMCRKRWHHRELYWFGGARLIYRNEVMLIDLLRFLPPSDLRDRTTILETFVDTIAAAGGTQLLITGIPLPNSDIRPLLLKMDWPDAWAARYLKGAMWRSDPMLVPSQGDQVCVRASHILASENLSPEARGHLMQSAEAGLVGQISFSFQRPGAYQLAVVASFDTPDDDTLAVLRAVLSRLVDRLWEISPEFLARPGQLTSRERQIVAETALGKTSAEIAEELDISARTVFAHLTAAGVKLGAGNKTSTVVEAIRYAQISV